MEIVGIEPDLSGGHRVVLRSADRRAPIALSETILDPARVQGGPAWKRGSSERTFRFAYLDLISTAEALNRFVLANLAGGIEVDCEDGCVSFVAASSQVAVTAASPKALRPIIDYLEVWASFLASRHSLTVRANASP